MTDEEFAQQVFAVLIGGVPAGTLLQALLVYVKEMHIINGLDSTAPMTLTQISRVAGLITQAISESEGAITYERT
jgi:hypothetical protein